jgi:hypothetical protein
MKWIGIVRARGSLDQDQARRFGDTTGEKPVLDREVSHAISARPLVGE